VTADGKGKMPAYKAGCPTKRSNPGDVHADIEKQEAELKTRGFLALVAVLAVAVALPLLAADPDGAAIFKGKCAMCHGPDGAGQTATGKAMKVRDLRSADVQKQTEKEMTTIVTDGKGKMTAYKGKLTDAEIAAVVKYIKTLK
jgi:cytochrome c6